MTFERIRDHCANLSLDRLREVLFYSPETGVFTRRIAMGGKRAGDIAGSKTNCHSGYIKVSVDNRLYFGHRLAWFYVHGIWPEIIDHVNGDRADNRLVNIRSVSPQVNAQNLRGPHKDGTSGFLGVSFAKGNRTLPWRANIRINNKQIHLGNFSTPEQAHSKYLSAKQAIHLGYVYIKRND